MSDSISRRAAIDAMWKALYAYEDLTEKQFMEHEELELGDWFQHRIFVQRMHEECMKAVNSLTSADRPTGEWIKTEHCLNDTGYRRWIEIECPFCGERPTYEFLENMKYCPNCGAKMEV